ncbi:YciE/YciF ferroxidase family protein [Planctomicrobium piriforme]|uniref:Ferritin-like metal-binding protein YciE n=1 Tax=Planctomicrobium piriforme TaxID=1576369 RepID=A0A1I3D878_9PLAN|nr:ferritin-like domain-containing protein [Planctomicrobium piriforme]SFH82915.1 Ferritin-like metal-binding protein YciE [Planctomicrobium piriforme]
MSLQSLGDAFLDELRDVLSAEKQLLKALPKMAKAASSEDLRSALEQHLEETKGQVERLEQVFESLDQKPRAKKCDAMAGILEEGASILEEDATPEVLDALIIAAAQKVEHYEIATYGTLCAWAEALEYKPALKLLKATMAEEETADKNLSILSETINELALAPAEVEADE